MVTHNGQVLVASNDNEKTYKRVVRFAVLYYLLGTFAGFCSAARFASSVKQWALDSGYDLPTAKMFSIVPSVFIASFSIALTLITGFLILVSPGRVASAIRKWFRLD